MSVLKQKHKKYEFRVLCQSHTDCEKTQEIMKRRKFFDVGVLSKKSFEDHVGIKEYKSAKGATNGARRLLNDVSTIKSISVYELKE